MNHVITQNVDGLHTYSGLNNVTELHGCSHRVKCLDCDAKYARNYLQSKFKDKNPDFDDLVGSTMSFAPDADAILTPEQILEFRPLNCESCGSDRLKPEVVFFGDNVPKPVVEFCYEKIDESDLLLVLGSTLQVYSSYRFAVRSSKAGKKIVSVGIGETRAAKITDHHLDAGLLDFIKKF